MTPWYMNLVSHPYFTDVKTVSKSWLIIIWEYSVVLYCTWRLAHCMAQSKCSINSPYQRSNKFSDAHTRFLAPKSAWWLSLCFSQCHILWGAPSVLILLMNQWDRNILSTSKTFVGFFFFFGVMLPGFKTVQVPAWLDISQLTRRKDFKCTK